MDPDDLDGSRARLLAQILAPGRQLAQALRHAAWLPLVPLGQRFAPPPAPPRQAPTPKPTSSMLEKERRLKIALGLAEDPRLDPSNVPRRRPPPPPAPSPRRVEKLPPAPPPPPSPVTAPGAERAPEPIAAHTGRLVAIALGALALAGLLTWLLER